MLLGCTSEATQRCGVRHKHVAIERFRDELEDGRHAEAKWKPENWDCKSGGEKDRHRFQI